MARYSWCCIFNLFYFCVFFVYGDNGVHSVMDASDFDIETIIQDLRGFIDLQEESLSNLERSINKIDIISTTMPAAGADQLSELQNHAASVKSILEQTTENIHRLNNVSMIDAIIGEIKDRYDDPPFTFDEEALLRLQSIYNLRSEHLANGIVRRTPAVPLTALECMTLAQAAYRMGDHFLAAEWTVEAKHRIFLETDPSVNVPTLLHTLATAASRADNPWAAMKLVIELLEMFPDDREVYDQCEEILDKVNTAIYNSTTSEWVRMQTLHDERGRNTLPKLSRMCRGYIVRDTGSSLRCMYSTLGVPWLTLQPISLEYLSDDPSLVILHQVFTENQVEHLKQWQTEGGSRNQKLLRLLSYITLDRELNNFQFSIHKYTVTGEENSPLPYRQDNTSTHPSCPIEKYKSMDICLKDAAGGAIIYPSLEKRVSPKKGTMILLKGTDGVNMHLPQHCPVLLGDKSILHAVYDNRVMNM